MSVICLRALIFLLLFAVFRFNFSRSLSLSFTLFLVSLMLTLWNYSSSYQAALNCHLSFETKIVSKLKLCSLARSLLERATSAIEERINEKGNQMKEEKKSNLKKIAFLLLLLSVTQ